jgi:hypothetical protein
MSAEENKEAFRPQMWGDRSHLIIQRSLRQRTGKVRPRGTHNVRLGPQPGPTHVCRHSLAIKAENTNNPILKMGKRHEQTFHSKGNTNINI